MVCSCLAGSVRAESVAASRMERALSEVASSLNGHVSRHGSQQSWLIQAQIWLQLGTHEPARILTHTHAHSCVHVHTHRSGYLRLTGTYTPSTIYPLPLLPSYTHTYQKQAHTDTLGHTRDTLTHRHANTRTYTHIDAHPHPCTCTHTHTHTHTHTRAHPPPYTHTHTHSLTEAAVCYFSTPTKW